MGVKGKIFEAKLGTAGNHQMHVGERLRDLRRLAGVTQRELAKRLDIDQTGVSRLEQRDDIRLSTLRGYIEALGASALT